MSGNDDTIVEKFDDLTHLVDAIDPMTFADSEVRDAADRLTTSIDAARRYGPDSQCRPQGGLGRTAR